MSNIFLIDNISTMEVGIVVSIVSFLLMIFCVCHFFPSKNINDNKISTYNYMEKRAYMCLFWVLGHILLLCLLLEWMSYARYNYCATENITMSNMRTYTQRCMLFDQSYDWKFHPNGMLLSQRDIFNQQNIIIVKSYERIYDKFIKKADENKDILAVFAQTMLPVVQLPDYQRIKKDKDNQHVAIINENITLGIDKLRKFETFLLNYNDIIIPIVNDQNILSHDIEAFNTELREQRNNIQSIDAIIFKYCNKNHMYTDKCSSLSTMNHKNDLVLRKIEDALVRMQQKKKTDAQKNIALLYQP